MAERDDGSMSLARTTIHQICPEDWAEFRDIRLAALADAPSAFAVTHAEAASRSDAAWAAMVRERCASAMSAAWLARYPDGRSVGLVGGVLATDELPTVDLVSMWVAPAARGEGLARRLVETVVAWAEQVGATSVHLWVTRGNDPAQHLYESAGFVVTGDLKALPSDPCKDEIRMIRDI